MLDWDVRRKQFAVGWKAMRCWFWPFVKSSLLDGHLRPYLSFLFTNLSCNYHCYYCYGSHVPDDRGMTWETATQSVDWLQSLGCRVLAFMGGEPLLRKRFILDVTRYAGARGFYVYLPTNGFFLDEAFIEEAADAGVDCINLALDCVDEKPGLPKALNRVRPQYEMLLEKNRQKKFVVMFNVNVTPRNVEDVKELTELAYRDRINVDYHICEPPLLDQPHFATDTRAIGFTPDDFARVDALFDWLLEKFHAGYNMANSPEHFRIAKRFIRREPIQWDCRAGDKTLVIQTDGRLMPCFELFNDTYDWGCVGRPRFDPKRLADIKRCCTAHCLSTCNFTTSYYGNFSRAKDWIGKYYRVRS